ncbi:MAG: hypothetical protein AB1476_05195 [Candidatus Hadarchaeota archaeon]
MDERGLAEFLAGKMALAMTSLALLGLVISFGSTVQRQGEREDLASVKQAIFHSIETADPLPGEVKLIQDLPRISADFRVIAVGSWSGKTQLVTLTLESGDSRTSGVISLNCPVNGGNFEILYQNPAQVQVTKNGEILLELV